LPYESSVRFERRGEAFITEVPMGLLRGAIAGYGAYKLGGGCFSIILIFIILYWLLGHFMR